MTASPPETIQPAPDGSFLIDAAFIAGKFDMPVEEARGLMRRGLFRSRVEKGEGEDAGRWRLTVRCGNRVWQGIVSEDGTVRHESMGLAGGGRSGQPT